MKKGTGFLWAILLVLLPALQSCDDSDGYSIGDVGRDWATVHVLSGNTYYLEGDSWGKLWPAASDLWNYTPVDGQRVLAYFNPLSDREGGDYDHDIKVEYLGDILTKGIDEMTADNEAEFGNDPVVIWKNDMWISGGYLNVVFQQNLPQSGKHRVSLVRNTTVEDPADGYIYLEYRYNTYDNLSGRWSDGAVSFNLNSLSIDESTKGIKVKLLSKENGEVVVPFEFNSQEVSSADQIFRKNNSVSTYLN